MNMVYEKLQLAKNLKAKMKLHHLIEVKTPPTGTDAVARKYSRQRLGAYVERKAKEVAKVDVSIVSNRRVAPSVPKVVHSSVCGEEEETCYRTDLTVMCGPNHFHPLFPMELVNYEDSWELDERLIDALIKVSSFTVAILCNALHYDEKLRSVVGFVLPGWGGDIPGHVIQVRTSVGTAADFGLELSFRVLKSKEEFDRELVLALQEQIVFPQPLKSPRGKYLLRLSEEQLETVAVAIGQMKSDPHYRCTQVKSVFSILVEAVHDEDPSSELDLLLCFFPLID